MKTCITRRAQVSPTQYRCVVPVPAVRPQRDVQRAQVIAEAKGKSRMRQGGPKQQMQRPPTPPVDPDNAEFVVFVRATKLPRWIPFTIVKGGPQANLLVKAMDGNFGKKFYQTTLINNIASVRFSLSTACQHNASLSEVSTCSPNLHTCRRCTKIGRKSSGALKTICQGTRISQTMSSASRSATRIAQSHGSSLMRWFFCLSQRKCPRVHWTA